MSNELEILKKKIIYRALYRGTKEMDILLSSFVNKNINQLDESTLIELEIFLTSDTPVDSITTLLILLIFFNKG